MLVAASPRPAEHTLTPGERWLSLLEVVLGACIVIGHNMFRIVPNENAVSGQLTST